MEAYLDDDAFPAIIAGTKPSSRPYCKTVRDFLDTPAPGHVPRREQIAYAASVAGALFTHDRSVAMIEGGTGIGKTRALMVSAIAYHLATGKRVAISTHTHHLQQQTMDEFNRNPKVGLQGWFEKRFGACPAPVLRMGMNGYISSVRAKQAVARALKKPPSDLDPTLFENALADFGNAAARGTTFAEYIADFGELPHGIERGQVVLQPNYDRKNDIGGKRYRMEAEAARKAAIVITNHALVALNARWGFKVLQSGNDDSGLGALIIDEADRFADAAELIAREDLSIGALTGCLEQMELDLEDLYLPARNASEANRLIGRAAIAVETLKRFFDREFRAHFDPETEIERHLFVVPNGGISDSRRRQCKIILADANKKLAETIRPLGEWIEDACKNGKNQDLATDTRIDFLEDYLPYLERSRRVLSLFAGGHEETSLKDGCPAITWSAVEHSPALRVIPIEAGRIARLYIDPERPQNVDHLIVTSAVLSNREYDPENLPQAIVYMDQALGIPKAAEGYSRPPFSAHYPSDFGEMDFVLLDPRLPRWTLPDNLARAMAERDNRTWDPELPGARTNPRAVEICAAAIRYLRARRPNGPAAGSLVLAYSYSDCKAIAAILKLDSKLEVLAQYPGDTLAELKHRYAKVIAGGRHPVLITPGAREGFDLPGSKNLIICRLPFSKPDEPLREAFFQAQRLWLERARPGTTELDLNRTIDRIWFGKLFGAVRRGLRQMVGRGIRQASDRVTLCITDPRFLPCNDALDDLRAEGGNQGEDQIDMRWADLRECIPIRFSNDEMSLDRAPFSDAEILTEGKLIGKGLLNPIIPVAGQATTASPVKTAKTAKKTSAAVKRHA